ncbi:hypothetical protein DV738_g4406, partial [Chaetothyriales sp. CBS 135597]
MFSRLTSVFWRRKGADSDSDRQQDSAGVHLGQAARHKRAFHEIDQSYSELSLEDADDGSTPDSTGRQAKRLRRDNGLADDSDDDSDEGDGEESEQTERARRRAEAASLGPGSGSGITSSAEHELFTHLYMRGYDPLIPTNWMLDFRTLPLALFGEDDDETRASEEQKPLIYAMQGSEFRATKALRDLFDTGRNLRAKIQSWSASSYPNPKPSPYPPRLELVLRKAIEKYMLWTLSFPALKSTSTILYPQQT